MRRSIEKSRDMRQGISLYPIGEYKENGITLIALAVTIIVLLILAGISIGALKGDNGIIGQAKGGKDSAEISEEKEIIEVSVVQAIDEDVYGNISTDIFRKKLNNNAGEGKTEVIDNRDTIVARFIEKNRYYEIDKDGNVEGPKELIKDENAGDLSKGGKADGSEEKPYEINCIEDLVTFSIMVNGGNSELGLASSNFSSKYVILTRTLDFKSIFSYNDYTTTKYGDLNTDGIIEDIRTELTKTDEGCIGFTPIGTGANDSTRFGGILDGKNNEIRNIYINISVNAGLFGGTAWTTIKNLGISGNITSTGGYAGGIVAHGVWTNYYKCYNKVNVTGKDYTGGIVGHGSWGVDIMENCYNMGEIVSTSGKAGGCAGSYGGQIINCYNLANITSKYSYAGGILGQSSGAITITNCYNNGDIDGNVYSSGGILADVYADSTVNNCYNVGKITNNSSFYSYTSVGIGATTANNCYNAGTLITVISKTKYVIGATTVNKCYYFSSLTDSGVTIESGAIDVEGKTCEEFVELLNSYRDENGVYPEGWKTWKAGENGYPTFELD